MTRQAKQFTYAITAVLTALLFILSFITGGGAQFASAAASAYSEVLEDLQRDETFRASDYKSNAKDYSINVIQIAEGTGGELFVYTHQPCRLTTELVASSINISKQENNSLEMSFPNYTLSLISAAGVFCKYQVEDFELEETEVRYYNISNILRPFEYMLDELPAVGTLSEVPNEVGQLWTARTVGDSVEYAVTGSDVVTITQKYIGFLDYNDGTSVGLGTVTGQHTIRNFVAFSTDLPIDRLKQVELQYSLADCSYEYCANPIHSMFDNSHGFQDYISRTKGEPVTQEPVVIKADETDENYLHGWFGHKYTWDKIQSTSDFVAEQKANENIANVEGMDEIEGTQWVLNFYKATYQAKATVSPIDNHITGNYEAVSDVIILRLMFEYDGVTFNLGVVDSKMTGDNKPLNGASAGLPQWAIILIVIGVVLIVLLVLAIVFPPVLSGLKLLFMGLFAPFRAIGRAIKNRKPKTAKRKHIRGATGKKRKAVKKKAGKKK